MGGPSAFDFLGDEEAGGEGQSPHDDRADRPTEAAADGEPDRDDGEGQDVSSHGGTSHRIPSRRCIRSEGRRGIHSIHMTRTRIVGRATTAILGGSRPEDQTEAYLAEGSPGPESSLCPATVSP